MSDEKTDWLTDCKDMSDDYPPPYIFKPEPHNDASRQEGGATIQRQGDSAGSTDSFRTWWRRAIRRVLVIAPSPKASQQQQARINGNKAVAAASRPLAHPRALAYPKQFLYPNPVAHPTLPSWVGHKGVACSDDSSTSTKLPRPVVPCPRVYRYSLDILCFPSPQAPWRTLWQQARLSLSSDHFAEVMRGPPVPWRINIDDHCYSDEIRFVDHPYPVPFFESRTESETPVVKVYYHNNVASTRYGMSAAVGGYSYERTIKLALLRWIPDQAYWCVTLSLTSRMGAGLRACRVVKSLASPILIQRSATGWIHSRDSIQGSVIFYAKMLPQPWMEATSLESGEQESRFVTSPRGVAHDEEMGQVVDDTLEKFIKGD
ncbi:hypothetical protein OQA88_5882 [Cercophora sp. LCS_1]